MTPYKEIGEISKKEVESLFEWIFPIDYLMRQEDDYSITSPQFHLSDSSWFLIVYPNGCLRDDSKGWIGLFLHKANGEPLKYIKYILEIEVDFGNKIFRKTHTFSRRSNRSGEPKLLKKTQLRPMIPELCPNVIITCRIKDYSSVAQQGIKSVSCAIPRETPNSVSCAIQKEIPDSVSCAIQTEGPDSVIDEENSEDGDCSSLDMKEVTILRDRMKDLLIKGSDYDVTICVQNKKFQAHRNILRARSPVFAMMLTHDTKENNTSTISIEDCDPDTFDEFLLYVYSGKTGNLTPSKALQLYYTADKYDFPVLKEQCVKLLKTSLSITSICDVVLLAAKHQEKELLEVASEFFARNMEEILVSVNWQTFLIQNPLEGNELYIKSMKILLPRK